MAFKVHNEAGDAACDMEEAGSWTYLVVDARGITMRQAPAYDCSFKCEDRRLAEGQLVRADRRLVRGWTRWLRIKGSGEWVFDVSPKNAQVRLVEVVCEAGSWEYHATCSTPVLHAPSLVQAATRACSSAALLSGDVVTVTEHYRLVGRAATFLKLLGGRGWLYYAGAGDGGDAKSRLVPPLPAPDKALSIVAPSDYIVIDPLGVDVWRIDRNSSVQGSPVRRLREGEVCACTERRCTEWGLMVRLSDGLWAAEYVWRGGSFYQAMVNVAVERGGHWIYRVTGQSVDLRAPSSFERTVAAAVDRPRQGDHVEIAERMTCGIMHFLKLADGRGWIYDSRQALAQVPETDVRNSHVHKHLWTGPFRGDLSTQCREHREEVLGGCDLLGLEDPYAAISLEVS
jgi:hypothetical protein